MWSLVDVEKKLYMYIDGFLGKNLQYPFRFLGTKEEEEFTQSNNYCLAENFDSSDGLNLGRVANNFSVFIKAFQVYRTA